MRRPLLVLAAPFAAGCLLSDGLGSVHEAVVLAALAAGLLALAPWAGTRRAAVGALAGAALALGTAATSVEGLRIEAGALRRALRSGALDGRVVHGFGRVRGDSLLRDGRLGFVLDLERVLGDGRDAGLTGRVRVEVGGEAEKPRLVDGERVSAWMALRPVQDARSELSGFGYCKSARLLERLPDDGACPAPASSPRVGASGLAPRSLARCRRAPSAAWCWRWCWATAREIDEATAEAFRASGTYHVLALSGAQVALVAALIAGGAAPAARGTVARGRASPRWRSLPMPASSEETCRSRGPR